MNKESGRGRSGAISLVSSVVARSKSKGQHSEAEDRTRASKFRSGMQAAFLRARMVAKGDQAEEFFAAVERVALFESNKFARQSVGFDYLVNLNEPAALPLEQEVSWLSYRIKANATSIRRFVADKQRIESLFLAGRFQDALIKLETHAEREGQSLWSVSLKIGLLQIVRGVEAQKEFVNEIRSTYKHAILPYLANNYSQRAESEISIGYYLENARRRLDRIKSFDLGIYLRYKVEESWPSGKSEVATILRMEQNHHEIDSYETFVAAVQHLAVMGVSGRLKQALQVSLTRLIDIGDYRVLKTLETMKNEQSFVEREKTSSNAMNKLLCGNVRSAYLKATNSYRDNPGSFSTVLVGAFARSHVRLTSRRRRPIFGERTSSRRLFEDLVEALIPVVRRGNSMQELEVPERGWSAKKYGHVLSGFAFFQALRSVTVAEESSTFLTFGSHLRIAALGCNETSLLDAFGPNVRDASNIASGKDAALQEFFARFQGRFIAKDGAATHGLRFDAASYADACWKLFAGEIESVEAEIPAALASPSRMLAAHAASLALEAYAEAGQIGLAAELIAEEHVNGGTSAESLPVISVFEAVDWPRLEEHAPSISLSIALYIFAQLGERDTTHSYRCFALETFLHSRGVTRPSDLKSQIGDFDQTQLAFFLGRVCEWSLLDMLPAIGSTREVLEERRDICALLLQMKKIAGTEEYRQELLAVTKELMVQQGLQTIDGSRVHVDIDALRIVLGRELAEGHGRYMSLVKQGVGVSEDFDTVLRDIARQEGQPKYLLSMPQNEADELLYEMIRQVRERFLFDIPHGLDSYLSKRIRHGSIIGYLRAPAEKEGIISAQNLDGSYKLSPRWGSAIGAAPRRSELEAVLQAFAKNFDGYLVRLKDVRLHVKSDQHPLGVFDAPLGPPLFHLIRSVTARDSSLQTFVDSLLASLWGLLNPSLVAARDLLLRDTARALADMFDGLRSQIAELVPPSQDRVELDLAAGRASAGVQAAVQTVAAWFTPLEGEDCDYSLEEVVEIALASVQAIAVSFRPSLVVHEDQVHRIAQGVMLLIVDAMFIALHNISRWSGSNEPVVHVYFSSDREAEVIKIRVVNSLVASQNYESERQKVLELKKKLFTPEGMEMARREGGSGLFKLSSITGQASSGRLDFGFVSPDEFFLELDLSLPSLEDSF